MWRSQDQQTPAQPQRTDSSTSTSTSSRARTGLTSTTSTGKNLLKKIFQGQWKGRSNASDADNGSAIQQLSDLPRAIREEVSAHGLDKIQTSITM